eukprot:CAMPEP_0115464932 /NCGR_PEP_ID=MMETSP0271-20121206/49139_1 /TAXON_ID=71861 /ORGANISM="Scrippsiella trochoidea, Strain CCMP3099" /LENGTH=141 /DNA_ID=CAMNT_0002891855 /DNA_START=249 /DNA_END=673 /DNA_ORIENTATION=-
MSGSNSPPETSLIQSAPASIAARATAALRVSTLIVQSMLRLAEGTDHRDYALNFLLHGNLKGSRLRCLTSHIYDAGSRISHRLRICHCVFQYAIAATVAEAIRGDVEYAHDTGLCALLPQHALLTTAKAPSCGKDSPGPLV